MTRWRYVSEAERRSGKRRVIVACDCGAIEDRYLSEITHGRSGGCRKCADSSRDVHPERVGSLQWMSRKVGKNPKYFSDMKRKNPERFEMLRSAGDGDVLEGYFLVYGDEIK